MPGNEGDWVRPLDLKRKRLLACKDKPSREPDLTNGSSALQYRQPIFIDVDKWVVFGKPICSPRSTQIGFSYLK